MIVPEFADFLFFLLSDLWLVQRKSWRNWRMWSHLRNWKSPLLNHQFLHTSCLQR